MNITLSVLLIVTALLIAYYWIDFYIIGGVQVTKEDWYIKFQKAFPIADAWLSVCAIIGAIGLLQAQGYGYLFAMLAASSLVFLSLMDINFNIQNGLYRLVTKSSQMKAELVGNVWFLGFGIALIVCLSPSISFN